MPAARRRRRRRCCPRPSRARPAHRPRLLAGHAGARHRRRRAVRHRAAGTQFQLAEIHRGSRSSASATPLGVDGIGLALIAPVDVLTPVCLLAAWHDVPEGGRRENDLRRAHARARDLHGRACSRRRDVFLFYVLFEAMLIPVYFLIGSFGGARRQYAAVKFLLFSLAGGLVMLVAVIALVLPRSGRRRRVPRRAASTGHSTWSTTTAAADVPRLLRRLRGQGADVARAHLAARRRHRGAARRSRCCSSGVLDKVGTFGMIRFCLPLFPEALAWATPMIIVLAVISVLYGALLAIGQTDMHAAHRLHLGEPLRLHRAGHLRHDHGGACRLDPLHGQPRVLHRRAVPRRGLPRRPPGQQADPRLRRLAAGRRPCSPACSSSPGLSSLALPGLSPVRLASSSSSSAPSSATARPPSIATLGIVLAALYILLTYQRMMTGPKPGATVGLPDLNAAREAGWSRRSSRRSSCSASIPSRSSTSSTRPSTHDAAARRRDRPGRRPRRHRGVPSDPRRVAPPPRPGRLLARADRLRAVAPMLIVAGAGWSGCSSRRFAPRRQRHTLPAGLTLAALVGAFGILVLDSRAPPRRRTAGGVDRHRRPGAVPPGLAARHAHHQRADDGRAVRGHRSRRLHPDGRRRPRARPQEAAASRAGSRPRSSR